MQLEIRLRTKLEDCISVEIPDYGVQHAYCREEALDKVLLVLDYAAVVNHQLRLDKCDRGRFVA